MAHVSILDYFFDESNENLYLDNRFKQEVFIVNSFEFLFELYKLRQCLYRYSSSFQFSVSREILHPPLWAVQYSINHSRTAYYEYFYFICSVLIHANKCA